MYEPEDVKRFHRHLRAMTARCDDSEAVAVMLDFERTLSRLVNERLAEMNEDFSLAYLASGTPIGRQSVWDRVKRGRETRRTTKTCHRCGRVGSLDFVRSGLVGAPDEWACVATCRIARTT